MTSQAEISVHFDTAASAGVVGTAFGRVPDEVREADEVRETADDECI